MFPQRTDCQFFWWHRAMVWIFYCGSIGKIGWWILWSISITIYNSLEFSRSYNKIDSKKLQVHSRDIDREKWILRYFWEVECRKCCVGRQHFVNSTNFKKNVYNNFRVKYIESNLITTSKNGLIISWKFLFDI